jgi:zinc transport system substrate-binding protein
MKRALAVLLLLAGGVLALVWLWPVRQGPTERLPVVASFYPLYEFARRVGGERVEVTTLVPPGVEPHDWEPSPRDVARLYQARLFVYNGAGLEPWVEKLLGGAPPSLVAVNVTEKIPLRAVDLPRHHGHHEEKARGPAPAGRESDPHVWLDPVLAQSQVEAIRAALSRTDPAHAPAYDANARSLVAALAMLHRQYEQGLADCARREFVTSHAAFGYLATRYRLTMIPIMGVAPEAEPSPAELARIARTVRRHGIRYVFFETLVSPKLAETLAREVGARTLVLNPVEGVTAEEAAAGKDYLTLMRENLANLRTGLECR